MSEATIVPNLASEQITVACPTGRSTSQATVVWYIGIVYCQKMDLSSEHSNICIEPYSAVPIPDVRFH
jgi:hypothetical protein